MSLPSHSRIYSNNLTIVGSLVCCNIKSSYLLTKILPTFTWKRTTGKGIKGMWISPPSTFVA